MPAAGGIGGGAIRRHAPGAPAALRSAVVPAGGRVARLNSGRFSPMDDVHPASKSSVSQKVGKRRF